MPFGAVVFSLTVIIFFQVLIVPVVYLMPEVLPINFNFLFVAK